MMDPILITGCSTGMGRAAALALLDRGHTVYATARRPESLVELEARGAHTLHLDVTDEESMVSAVAQIEAAHGAVGTLINNAGWGAYGPVENVDVDHAREQFEANVFGLGRLTQLVLPRMREAGRGRIVNVSSIGGRITLPLGGWYHASKYAVEALSDALRFELHDHGIDVVLIEPGLIRTDFAARVAAGYSQVDDSAYQSLEAANVVMYEDMLSGRQSTTVDVASRTFVEAVESRRPQHRYVITGYGKFMVQLRRLLGSRVTDGMLRRGYGQAATRAAARSGEPALPTA